MTVLEQHRVLVVDDDAVLRQQISIYLTANGFIVLCAEDGVEAMEALARERPDALLLDIKMPRMDGIEVARRVSLLVPPPKVILISGYDAAVIEANQAELDVFAIIEKPVPLNTLMRLLHKALATGEPSGGDAVKA